MNRGSGVATQLNDAKKSANVTKDAVAKTSVAQRAILRVF
jgi:hypothetical protein